jgi:hypothetical protein
MSEEQAMGLVSGCISTVVGTAAFIAFVSFFTNYAATVYSRVFRKVDSNDDPA